MFPFLLLLLSLVCHASYAQTNEWAWIGGSSLNEESPAYGTLGTSAPGNTPGSRYLAATWTDSGGNLWLFGGGQGPLGTNENLYNDMWEFNPTTNEWTWVGGDSSANQPGVYGTQGEPASGTIPGARDGAANWTDGAGNFWIFGGVGYDSAGNAGLLNDMWEFNPSKMQWTWISGSSTVTAFGGQTGVYGTLGTPAAGNVPGGRESPVVWLDKSGDVWLFGGFVIIEISANSGDVAGFNDLWRFNPSTREWTWMGGDSTGCNYGVQSGVWGTMGTPAAGNIPSCRFGASAWTDSSGNFWLFGGEGRDIDGYWGDLNNVWEFNPATMEWAWMGGTNIIDLPYGVPLGTYGSVGIPAAGNIPTGRRNATTWIDKSGKFWMFGGIATGFEGDSGNSILNDLWEFSPYANEWTSMGGSSSLSGGETGIYGTLGVAAPSNFPGDRWGAAGWTDRDGNLWFFGGEGNSSELIIFGDLSDLWKYVPLAPAPQPSFAVVDPNNQALNNTQSFVVQAGTSGTTTVNTLVSDGFASPVTLQGINLPAGITTSFSPDTITGDGSSQVTVSVGLDVPQGNYVLTVAGTSQGATETANVSLTVTSPPPANFNLAISPSTLTVKGGSQGTATLTVTPEYGFNTAISFACSGLPSGAACSFSPATVTPSGPPTTTQVTISTSTQTSYLRSSSRPFSAVTALAMLLLLLGRRKRPGFQIMIVLAVFAGLAVLSGCGGESGSESGSGPIVTPVTSSVTITATGGNWIHTSALSLTVN